MQRHLRPTGPIAPDALLPGDPGRALALAQALMVKPRMSNHHRGLWGYYGETAAGDPLTIQATGIGGPSGAAVLTELAQLGVRRAIRIGTCVAAGDAPALGEPAVVTEAVPGDGTSWALGARAPIGANGPLAAGGEHPAIRVLTVDLLGNVAAGDGEFAAIDLQTAPLLALGAQLGVEVSALLVATAQLSDGRFLAEDELERAELEMGRLAMAALRG